MKKLQLNQRFLRFHLLRRLRTNYIISLHHHPSHPKDDSKSSFLSKEILGPPKTFDFTSQKNILEKTLGTYKDCSSSHLGTSVCGKHKVKGTTQMKSSFKTRSKTSRSAYSYASTSSRNGGSILLSLVRGKQSLSTLTLVVLILITFLLF